MSILIVSSGLPLPSVTVGVAATFRSPVPVVPTVPIGPSGGRYIPVLQARFQAFPTTPTVPFNNQWWPLHPRSPGTFPGSPNPQSRLSRPPQSCHSTTLSIWYIPPSFGLSLFYPERGRLFPFYSKEDCQCQPTSKTLKN